jgi:hypothetical protein
MSKKSKATIPAGDYDYKTLKVRDEKTGKVRHSTGTGDAIAKAMLLFVAAGGTAAKAAKDNDLKMKADGRNEGLFRMAVGNALRGLVRNGTPVKIGKITIKTLSQAVALPKLEAAPAKPARKASKSRVRKTEKAALAA